MEWKLDGIRIQAHLSGGSIRLFTRTLDDITARLPEVVAALARLPVTAAVLDGELIALREDGRPLPFQDTASRTASFEGGGPAVPLSVFLFDVLHLDGADLIDAEDQQRHAALARSVPAELLMPRLVTASAEEATAFFTDALAHGHEGVVVKSLTAPYAAGRRGARWIRLSPAHARPGGAGGGAGTAASWLAVQPAPGRARSGHRRLRHARQDVQGADRRAADLADRTAAGAGGARDTYTLLRRAELVVEIAFDGVQRSPRYPGGVALRFARVLRTARHDVRRGRHDRHHARSVLKSVTGA